MQLVDKMNNIYQESKTSQHLLFLLEVRGVETLTGFSEFQGAIQLSKH